MTITNEPSAEVAVPTELVTVIIDGVAIGVPKGTLVIRAAEMLGIEIPRFCDHPLLEPVAACRACLIEIDGVPKPQPACAQVVSDGMQVHTQYSSDVARLAQEGVMEFLLLNHPLDCPVCDKGGECPLQNQAMSIGRPESRFTEEKRTFDKPINVSAQILLDRERCVSCARCTRFADQIAGDPMLELLERGAQQQVGTADDEPFDSYFSGNTIQICPVGALTSATYRFRARPFDLVSVPTSCEHCASGCSLRTDYRRSTVTRRLAWDDPAVNEEWNCDKGRFAFVYQQQGRIEWPLVRENGELRTASWPEALAVAARGLHSAGPDTAVLVGGRSTMEDAYAYSRFARVALGTDNIDFRARANSEEEREFLAAHVAGTPIKVEYADLETAPIVLLVAFEPEDESPIVFLRLRKAAGNASGKNVTIASVAAGASRGLAKMNGILVPAKPGEEATALANLPQEIQQALSQPGAVIMVGERAASAPGALSAAALLSQQTGAALAWVPRRAGERGALDAGALAGLLPGGRPITDPAARSEVARIWGIEESALPQQGLSGMALHDAVDSGRIRGAVVGGVELSDYPHDAAEALGKVDFIVSLENHHSAVTAMADVVLPVGVVTEKSGTFLDWEGRPRPFGQVFRDAMMNSDAAVLAMLADSMGHPLPGAVNEIRAQMGSLGPWTGARTTMGPARASATTDGVRLETWRLLLDLGVMQEGDPHLAATARPTVARMSARTAQSHGIGDTATIHGPAGSVTAPVEIDDSMVDSVVWLPMNSEGSRVYRDLGAGHGDVVRLAAGTHAGGLS